LIYVFPTTVPALLIPYAYDSVPEPSGKPVKPPVVETNACSPPEEFRLQPATVPELLTAYPVAAEPPNPPRLVMV
jgi:hypothetical protein